MFDIAKCFVIIEESAELLGLAPGDYTTTRSELSEDGLIFTVSFYDATDNLIGDRTVSV